jgi:hypothetical protein
VGVGIEKKSQKKKKSVFLYCCKKKEEKKQGKVRATHGAGVVDLDGVARLGEGLAVASLDNVNGHAGGDGGNAEGEKSKNRLHIEGGVDVEKI